MKKCKILVAIVLLVAICLGLCACGISQRKAIGTWSGSYVYDGNRFSRAFTLSADGTYSEVTYKNGEMSDVEIGTYEVKGGKVILHEDGNMGVSTVYKYRGGALVNNGHKFYQD